MPPSFLVDQHGQLVDSYGGAEALLKVKGRRPTQNLLDMLGDELRTVVSGVLHRVRKDADSVRYDGLAIPGLAGTLRAARRAAARSARRADARADLAARRRRAPAGAAGADRAAAGAGGRGRRRAARRRSRRACRRTACACCRTSSPTPRRTCRPRSRSSRAPTRSCRRPTRSWSPRTKSCRAPTRSCTRSTRSSTPSTPSTRRRTPSCPALNDDIEHLLNGTDVGTLFLDRELCIRKFTPRIAEIFKVIPHDIGRPLQAFSHDLTHPTLMRRHRARAARPASPFEAQTWDKRGRCYFLRILPYRGRTEASSADGRACMTLTDISALEQARAKLAQLSAIVESSDDAIVSQTVDGIVTSWNDGAARLYGYSADEAIGRHASFLWPSGQKEEIEVGAREGARGRRGRAARTPRTCARTAAGRRLGRPSRRS